MNAFIIIIIVIVIHVKSALSTTLRNLASLYQSYIK